MIPLTICIGFDSKEPLTLAVLTHSILSRASRPVRIIPIVRKHLGYIYTRSDPAGTTEFSLTRFLTPWLANYEGEVLFMDSDMVVLTDIHKVVADARWPWSDANPKSPGHVVMTLEDGTSLCAGCAAMPDVWVCKHDYVPRAYEKATGPQTAYPRKNWSSFMLFNAPRLRERLTPDYVNSASPADLHRFAWASDDRIGELSLTWNWLVGEYEDNKQAYVLHYTLGAPCFPGYEHDAMSEIWWDEYRAMMAPMKTYKMPEAEMYGRESGR